MNKIEPIEGASLGRTCMVRINGELFRKSNGTPVTYKNTVTACIGAAREVDRRKRLAVTIASRLPETSA